MAATLIGTTGNWGITSAETGLLIQTLEQDSVIDEALVKNNVGEDTGGAYYNDRVEVSFSGLMASTSGFSKQIGESITFANTIANTHLQASTAGVTVLKQVTLRKENEGFESVDGRAVKHPFFTS
jgi:hypothetical protein